jgi:hypothetical protein
MMAEGNVHDRYITEDQCATCRFASQTPSGNLHTHHALDGARGAGVIAAYRGTAGFSPSPIISRAVRFPDHRHAPVP